MRRSSFFIQPKGCICKYFFAIIGVVSNGLRLYSRFKDMGTMDRIFTDFEIGQKIRELRLQTGLTQEKLAEILGITFQQVQKYERGLTKVNLQKLQQLAAALKVAPAVFFDGSSSALYKLEPDEMELLKSYRTIRQESYKSSIRDIISGLSKLRP